MNRRGFCRFVGLGAAAVAAPRWLRAEEKAESSAGAKKPNFIVIFADDQGYADLGCFGAEKIRTPNLDRMAAQGVRFTDFYSAAPLCSASRTALMTGRYHSRTGIKMVLNARDKKGLDLKEVLLPQILKPQGYATAVIGKWHLGHTPEYLPTRRGFDSYFGIPYSNDMNIDPQAELADDIVLREGMTVERIRTEPPKKRWVPLMRDEKVIEYPADQSTLTKRYTEEAIRFITANKNKPFFLYLPHNMPHDPVNASERFKGKSAAGPYGDAVEEIDWSAGEILKTLQTLGIDDNTLVIFTSDNGPWQHLAPPLHGGKGSVWEGGMREPCIMWWPGRLPAGKVCSEIAGTIDLLPTFARLAGGQTPQDRPIDGKDIWPLMSNPEGAQTPHEAFFYVTSAVRSGPWKLHWNKAGVQLYDLKADIGETKNVADQHPDVVERLKGMLEAYDREVGATPGTKNKPGEVKVKPMGRAPASAPAKKAPKGKPTK
ncbi:MAG: sulfatase [Candidatus Sumerlaeota bacterium]|nr:sulfatase [Candidatus Sumerlaeota bacterium]